MPFGIKSLDGTQMDFDKVYETIIKPISKLKKWQVYRIDEVVKTGVISNHYLQELFEADIVLAEVSSQNANVFYELGIRQTISSKGTILIAKKGSQIPFDLTGQRIIFYDNTASGIKKIKQDIIKILNDAEYQTSPVNDFFTSYRKTLLSKNTVNEQELEFKHQFSLADSLGEYILIWQWVQDSKNINEYQLLDLSREFVNRQRWNLAEEVLLKSFKLNPKSTITLKELGWIISKKGNDYYEEALNYLYSALELDPKNSEVLGIIGGIFKSQNNLEEAVKYYTEGLKYSPNDNYMLITRAALEILVSPTNPSKGIESYKNIIKKITSEFNYSSNIWSLVNLAEAIFVTGSVEDSISQFEEVFSRFKSIKPIISTSKQIFELGRSGFKNKESQRILNYLKESLEKYDDQITVPSHLLIDKNKAKLPLIIHISDLHFGKKPDGKVMHRFIPTVDDRRDLATHLIEELKLKYENQLKNCVLIISGDLVYMATEDEYNEALNCLNKVCSELEIRKDRVVIVPGNHDVNWLKDKTGESKRFEDYLVFIYRFYGEELLLKLYPFLYKEDFSITASPIKPENIIAFHYIDDRITIVGMNSCVYENSQNHYGFVGWQQFSNIRKQLDKIDELQKSIKIAVIHHQMHPFPEPLSSIKTEQWIDISIIRDAGFVEKSLEELNFDLVFHGHKHHPQIRETKVSIKHDEYKDTKSLFILGGGSVAVENSERGSKPNHFQTLEFLSFPRNHLIDFAHIIWHELDDEIGAEWQSIKRWTI